MPETGRQISPKQLIFRETFLWRLYRPGLDQLFRVVGDALFDLLNEAGEWGPEDRENSTELAELRAVLQDLEHILDYMEEVVEEIRANDFSDDYGRVDLVSGIAGRLARIVVDMSGSSRCHREPKTATGKDEMPVFEAVRAGEAPRGCCLAGKDSRTMGVGRPRPVWHRSADVALEGASRGVRTPQENGCRSRGDRPGALNCGASLRVSQSSREGRPNPGDSLLARERLLMAVGVPDFSPECSGRWSGTGWNSPCPYDRRDGYRNRSRRWWRSERLSPGDAGGRSSGFPHFLSLCPRPSASRHWVS